MLDTINKVFDLIDYKAAYIKCFEILESIISFEHCYYNLYDDIVELEELYKKLKEG